MTRSLARPLEGRPQAALSVSSDLRRIVAALDAREGNVAPTELIPPAAARSGGGGLWIAGLVVLLIAVAAWWFAWI